MASANYRLQQLRHGRIDIAFVRPPTDSDDEIRFVLLSTESMVVVVPKGHRMEKREAVSLEELRDELFVLYSRTTRSGLPEMVISACEASGFNAKVVQDAPQISSTINLVASGLGISIVPSCMRSSRADAVCYIPLSGDGANLVARLGLAYRVKGLSPAAQNLLKLIAGDAKLP